LIRWKNWENFQPDQLEKYTKESFSVLGKVEKKHRKRCKTYDFKIDEVKLLIEVTWISEKETIHYHELSDKEFFNRISRKVKHVCKDHSNYPISRERIGHD